MSFAERVRSSNNVKFADRVKRKAYVVPVENYPEPITPGEGEDVEAIIEDYVNLEPVTTILKRYNISSGQLTSHLSARGIERRMTKRRKETLFAKLAKYTETDIRNILTDYQIGTAIQDIYNKYDIHKNGLYYLLDTHGIERRGRKKKEMAK